MKYLTYEGFLKENLIPVITNIPVEINILESIITDSDVLLKSIKAEEVDLFKIFELSETTLKPNYNIEDLLKSKEFLNKVNNKQMKLSKIEETEDSETFIENTFDVKFILVHKKNNSELEKPEFIIFQFRKKVENKWGDVKCYRVNGDIQNLYDNLTNKTIEFKKGNKTYIYYTSNSGNNWQLKNTELKDEQFLDLMDKDQIKMILQDKDILITIK